MAYASVASLTRTIELLLTSNSPMPPLICDHREEFFTLRGKVSLLICDHREEFLTLREKVSFLEVFLKKFEKKNDSREMTDLEVQIQEVANVAEYTIQLRITEIVMENDEKPKKKAAERLRDSLIQVIEDIDRVQKETTKIQDKSKQASEESLDQDSSSAKHILNVKGGMVGRDDEREKLLAELLGGSSGELKVIPIVGMGGIGKTTLAEDVFTDIRTQSHFDVRSWATISKQHNVKDILISLLRSTKEKDDTVYMEDEAELADMLQKSLKSKRYLFVLDDMWSSEAWDAVRQCFPSDNKRSRILLTTRNKEVACYTSAEDIFLLVGLMGPVESWNLFKGAAFANETLSTEFETIGKQIVDKCHGLPLTIVVVAGLLSRSKRSIDVWGNVAKDVMSSVTTDPNEKCLDVLGLSYNHLTSDLKACLLYFGIFPEDSEISVKRLARLWIAEGFLKLEKDLEGEAEKCLQDLIDRSLVLVSKKCFDGTKIRSCKVHDLIYEMCLREIQSKKIFTMNDIVSNDEWDAEKAQNHGVSECHHLSRHKMQSSKRLSNMSSYYRALLTPGHNQLTRMPTDEDNIRLLNQTRSILFFCYSLRYIFTLEDELIHFNFLRILDLKSICFYIFPSEILSLIWLRYLVLRGHMYIPPEICRLWNLQTFQVTTESAEYVKFPEQIWELMQLRHLKVDEFSLPNLPSSSVDEEKYLYFPNIHTISGLSPGCCTKEVMSGIRNVKKLVIIGQACEEVEESIFVNLVYLHQLETLSIVLQDFDEFSPITIPSQIVYPATLKKLTLSGTRLSWEDINIISELPNIEVLNLIASAVVGEEWSPIYWKATNETFPVLERLVIQYCTELEEIPIEFAEIGSLQLIELEDCTAELGASAKRIEEEQEYIGNKPVEVRILGSKDEDEDEDEDDDSL